MKMHAIRALLCFLYLTTAVPAGTTEIKGTGGYVTVRPKAHMFWHHYTSPKQVSSSGKPWPTILWMQGGLGESSVGIGNFLGIGPLDANLKPRNSTWLNKANLLFVDHPVGVGYSYVEDKRALAKTDSQAASDMIELLKVLSKEIPSLQCSPLFLVGEFYGAKMSAITGLYMARAIKAGSLRLTLGGVVLGNGWISPADSTMSYTPMLSSMSRLDSSVVGPATSIAMTFKKQMEAQQYAAAYKTWSNLLDLINTRSGQVNMNNILVDNTISPVPPNTIDSFMNGIFREQAGIGSVPKDVTWKSPSLDVFDAQTDDFMKPVINEVYELLVIGVNVALYSGQLDVMSSTMGTEASLKKLKWDGIQSFLGLPREPKSYCQPYEHPDAFVRSYKNLQFFWVLRAGRMVPIEQPCTALGMIGTIMDRVVSSFLGNLHCVL